MEIQLTIFSNFKDAFMPVVVPRNNWPQLSMLALIIVDQMKNLTWISIDSSVKKTSAIFVNVLTEPR